MDFQALNQFFLFTGDAVDDRLHKFRLIIISGYCLLDMSEGKKLRSVPRKGGFMDFGIAGSYRQATKEPDKKCLALFGNSLFLYFQTTGL